MGVILSLFRNSLSLTLLSILIRLISLFSQTRISAALGAEGMGLLQLAFGVQIMAVTVACSGVRYSASRLISEEVGLGRVDGVRPVLRSAVLYALAFSVPTGLLLYIFADGFAAFAGDPRIAQSLRNMAPGLPCLALSSVFSAYFTASGKSWKAGVVQLIEQTATTVLLLFSLRRLPAASVTAGCSTVGACIAAGDYISLLTGAVFLVPQLRGLTYGTRVHPGKRLCRLSLPLAFSSYARSALSTLQHMLIPKALRSGGASAEAALSVYGIVGGMAMPVLSFFSVFFISLAELLIPELTQLQVSGRRGELLETVRRVLSLTVLLSATLALLLFLAAPALGTLLYSSSSAGEYIRLLSPLIILQYSDHVVDGMLKGLGHQLHSMYINISDAALTLLAVTLLLPRFGITAYIGILYGSEAYNLLLSALELRRAIKCGENRIPQNITSQMRGDVI